MSGNISGLFLDFGNSAAMRNLLELVLPLIVPICFFFPP